MLVTVQRRNRLKSHGFELSLDIGRRFALTFGTGFTAFHFGAGDDAKVFLEILTRDLAGIGSRRVILGECCADAKHQAER